MRNAQGIPEKHNNHTIESYHVAHHKKNSNYDDASTWYVWASGPENFWAHCQQQRILQVRCILSKLSG